VPLVKQCIVAGIVTKASMGKIKRERKQKGSMGLEVWLKQ
jgi:hypothetical protein